MVICGHSVKSHRISGVIDVVIDISLPPTPALHPATFTHPPGLLPPPAPPPQVTRSQDFLPKICKDPKNSRTEKQNTKKSIKIIAFHAQQILLDHNHHTAVRTNIIHHSESLELASTKPPNRKGTRHQSLCNFSFSFIQSDQGS